MKIKSTQDNIIFLKADNQYELTSTFMRLQEFYEGASSQFRSKYFALEDYMDWYANEYGNFTYTSDWSGFNIPGPVVRKFFDVFEHDLLVKEKNLRDTLSDWIYNDKKFYLIGTYENDNTVDHEYAHAYYYMDKKYAKKMNYLVDSLPKKFRILIEAKLTEDGYCNQVLEDETQAYLATNTMIETDEMVKKNITLTVPWDHILAIQKIFAKKYKELDDE